MAEELFARVQRQAALFLNSGRAEAERLAQAAGKKAKADAAKLLDYAERQAQLAKAAAVRQGKKLLALAAEQLEIAQMAAKAGAVRLRAAAMERVEITKLAAAAYGRKIRAAATEKICLLKGVAMLQLAMLRRRCHAACSRAKAGAEAQVRQLAERVQAKYDAVRTVWRENQHFTFWLIPADGQTIAKKQVKKSHLKYAITGVLSFLLVVSVTIGTLAHFAIQNEEQRQELAEYKATKQAQEQKIQELQQIAEKNQKQLAYLSKLEDKVRTAMEKTGAELPPKSDISAYGGKGGPADGDTSMVSIMLEQQKNITSQAAAKQANLEGLLNAIENENYRREMTPDCWPTSGGFVSSSYGGRANPFDGYSSDWHPGIDIANDYGAPVYASASGYVQQAGWYGGYGRYVRLSHDFGYETAYGHMSSIAVSSGEYVKKGQIIGYVGSSGYSTGPHLHFEILKYGEQVNPAALM